MAPTGASAVPPAPVTQGALTGAMISGGFGIAWALWGASGLHGATAIAVRVAGIVLGLGVIGRAFVLRGTAAPDDESMFRSRPYLLIVLGEFVALIAGGALLNATGAAEYVPVWFAAVVGVHLGAFALSYWPGFLMVGAVLLIAAVAGLVVGLTGGGRAAIAATTGVLAAVVLLSAGAATVLRARKEMP